MKRFFEIILGLLAIVLMIGFIVLIVGVIGALFYGAGWIVGWIIHLMVGPDYLFGLEFKQFVGIIFLLVGFIGVGRPSIDQNELKMKIDEGIQKSLKKYRGY